jgi:hypothetical protein
MSVPVNYWAILVAAIVNIVLGFLWYGPFFGKSWQAMMGFTQESMAAQKAKGMMTSSMVIMMIGSLLMAYVLAHSLIFAATYTKTTGIAAGLMVAVWTWLGFIAPVSIGTVIWEGKPWKLWIINAVYYIVGLALMGIILALWV